MHIINFKLQQTSNNLYLSRFYNSYTNIHNIFVYGVFSLFRSLRLWIVGLVISITYLYIMFLLKSLPFLKLCFIYFLVASLFYLLISGFVFFFKKYQYRYYTTAIQRFWRRTLIIFWAIEGCLFLVFFYLTVNANQEPIYMYDNIQFYKTHLFSWRFFLLKILPTIIIIIITYFTILSLNFFTFTKISNMVLLITVIILFIAWSEFYQFFHLLNYYGTLNWVYDIEDHLWNLEAEFKRTRIINHYTTICLVAKFWHVVFAVIFWIFSILRFLESERYRYPLFSANLQNFIIIYIMSWLYMYPWLKYTFRKILDMPFYWFFVNNRKLGFFLFFNDCKLYFYTLSTNLISMLVSIFVNFSVFSPKVGIFYFK